MIPFKLDDSEYKRNLDLIGGYVEQNALYCSLLSNDSLERCRDYVRRVVKEHLSNPPVVVLNKGLDSDREVKETSLLQYLSRIEQENLVFAPSLTAYYPESVRQSTHSLYLKEGATNRGIVKKEMFDAERAAIAATSDEEKARLKSLASLKKGQQNNFKLNNNSYSGATVSKATILYYKSTHSSLTSTCRVATSYANASNEKFIRGNRHYYTPEIVKSNLMAILTNTDMKLLEAVMVKYRLLAPSVETVMRVIEESSEAYWREEQQTESIRLLISRLKPLQRAAVLYTGDFYNLYKQNEAVIREMLTALITVKKGEGNAEGIDKSIITLATYLCGKEKECIAATAEHLNATLNQYHDLFKIFFLTKVFPSSIYNLPNIRRKAVPVSDTDSSMFTLAAWIEMYFGSVVFTTESRRLAFVLIFLIERHIEHILAALSANLGVSKEKLRQLAMKNEYYFDVLFLTGMAKHYFASVDAQEGVFKDPYALEIKGVGLRDSKIPPAIRALCDGLIRSLIDTLKAGKKIDIKKVMGFVADIEEQIKSSLEKGNYDYLSTAQIKPLDSYKNADNPTYRQYVLWNTVFGPLYGEVPPPPYQAIKVSIRGEGVGNIRKLLLEIKDEGLRRRLKDWLDKYKPINFNTLLVPFSIVETNGMPEEVVRLMDVKKVISNITSCFYIVLGSLGVPIKDMGNGRLVSDIIKTI